MIPVVLGCRNTVENELGGKDSKQGNLEEERAVRRPLTALPQEKQPGPGPDWRRMREKKAELFTELKSTGFL